MTVLTVRLHGQTATELEPVRAVMQHTDTELHTFHT